MFEYRVLDANVKYQQQWIAQGYTVAFSVDWHDFTKTMTIAEYHSKHLAIIQTYVTLMKAMPTKSWRAKRRKMSRKKYRHWFLFVNEAHLITAIIHTNITLVNSK
jgi:hypothetical protein